ncbi:MAG: DUF2917 domain-containing protein [Betaproteobacteria bacterium]
MGHGTTFRRLALAPGDLLNLDDARGTTVSVGRGQVWLTQYGDLADHVLDAGTSWAIERNGRTILQAQNATVVDLTGPGASNLAVPLASTAEPFQVSAWIERVANEWMDRRWSPYL